MSKDMKARLAKTLEQRATGMTEYANRARSESAGSAARSADRSAKSYRDQTAKLRRGGAR